MMIDFNFLLSMAVALAACGGAYAAIRADLGRLHERASMALDAANKAHARIDGLRNLGPSA